MVFAGFCTRYLQHFGTSTFHFVWWPSVFSNPPTPAFAKAGAAPGTTGGVELGSRLASKGTRPQTLPTLPQASKATTLTATATTSRLPFARPQTPQTLPTRPQASKATTLTATTCPCHLSFRGFKTAVCPPSNPRQQLLQLQLLLQDCRLLGLKPPKRFQPARRPPRQQLLQLLHAPAICLSGGSRLPFARPQTPQTLPQASKAPAICFSGGSRLPFARPQTPQTPQTLPQASKATTLTATCPQTPQTLPTLPQASKATTLTATTCPCHLFFRGFKTAVCPPSNPPYYFKTAVCSASNPPNASNPPAGLQGNNSYSYYMPLPSVFQGVQDCRLPALKSKATTLTATATTSRLPFARPQTPQTLPTRPQASKATTLTATTWPAICLSGGSRLPFARPQTPQTLPQASKAPAICFSGGSRLPFARPQTPQTPQTLPQALMATTLTATCPQTPQTLPQASKATTLTATCPQTPQTLPTLPQASEATTLTATTCPCHLFFRGFKTAVCPASNPPNASNPPAGLQGNNSCGTWLSGRKQRHTPPNASNPPAGLQRQQLLQLLHAPAICFSGGSRLPFARPHTPQTLPQASKAPAICFSGGSSLPFGRPQTPQTPQTLPQASKATTLTATCPQTPQTLPTLPQASKATTLTATTCPCHLFIRGFKTAVCQASNPPNASNPPAGLQGNNSCGTWLSGRKQRRTPPNASNPPAGLQGNNSYSYSYYFKTAVCSASNPPNASNPPAGLQGNNSYSYYMPLPSVFQGVQDCRLPALKSKATTLTATATTSRLPFARHQTPQTLPTRPQASKATTLTATTCPCHLSFRGFKTAVCPASNPPNPPAGLQGTCHLFFRGFKTAVCPPSNPRQQLLQLQLLLQDCRLLGIKPPKRFQPARRPPRQQLLQLLHAPAICLTGGSRLPFARPQIQGNNSYSYSYYFKTAVCSASNPPNASNPPAGLQGNNSYSYYMPLPSVFQGAQDCRLPALKPPKPSRRPPRHLPSVFQGAQDCRLPALKPPKPPKPSRRPPRQQLLQLHALKPPKRFQPSRRPPRQQLLQLLHAPAICFSGGSCWASCVAICLRTSSSTLEKGSAAPGR